VDRSFSGHPFTADIFGFDPFSGGFLFDLNPEGLHFYETLPREVKISSIYDPYYRQRFLFAKRVVEAKDEEKTDPIAEIIEREKGN
jgi:hypothetical protein